MARTALSVQSSSKSGLSATYSAADATNGMLFTNDGGIFLHVKNGGAGSINVTITSVPCSHGRTEDQIVSIGAGADEFIGPFKKELFNQKSGTDVGKVYVDFDIDTSVTLAAIKL